MKSTITAVAFAALLVTSCFAEKPATEKSVSYSRAQLQSLINNASKPADYLALRDYYRTEAETDALRATEERLEWQRRSANPMVYAKKYPNSVDSAHYLYQYYLQAADSSMASALHYERLAEAPL